MKANVATRTTSVYNHYSMVTYAQQSAVRHGRPLPSVAALRDAIAAAVLEYNALQTGTLLSDSDSMQQAAQSNDAATGWLQCRLDRFVKSQA